MYEDCKDGLITEQEYTDMKIGYEQTYKELNVRISNLSQQIVDVSNQKNDVSVFVSRFKEYSNITEITRDVVVALVDEIVVYEGRQIKIIFKYRDEFERITSIYMK